MRRNWNKKTMFSLIIFPILFQLVAADDCTYKNYDFNPLKSWIWEVVDRSTSSPSTYHISVCKALSPPIPCEHNTAVCHSGGDLQNPVSVGNYDATINITEHAETHELLWMLTGDECSDGVHHKTVIAFRCAKTLGAPALIDSDEECVAYFEWPSSVACKFSEDELKPASNEVKCYVDDTEGRIDLSPLVKLKDGYLVESTSPDSEFYINVCREIHPSGATSACDKASSGACRLTGDQALDAGTPKSALERNSAGIYLTYTSDVKPDSCPGNPQTQITFKCPDRGQGKPPRLLSDLDCRYIVEWETEYACSLEQQTSSTCQLTLGQHNIDIDLAPLMKTGGNYRANSTDPKGDKIYNYYVNICGDAGVECPDTDHKTGIAVCQTAADSGSSAWSLGNSSQQTLRYSDRELTLMYKGGQTCHTHFQRETLITFLCPKDTDQPPGLHYVTEGLCTYMFEFVTELACISLAVPSQCEVVHDGKRYDLSPLVRTEGDNWQGLDDSQVEGSTDEEQFYINVCHDLLPTSDTKDCPQGAAICMKSSSTTAKSLGKYTGSPTYATSTGDIMLTYTDGSPCGDSQNAQTITTVITLWCNPGRHDTAPILTSKSECQYEFDWRISSACVLSQKTGTDCKVTDDVAGYSFDLNPLTKQTGDQYYKVEAPDGHDYYINVCSGVTNTACNKRDDQVDEVGICQVKSGSDSEPFSGGKPSDKLAYFDGIVNLTYTGGDPYNDPEKTMRKTEIVFTCDPDAGKGQPEFLTEDKRTYSFQWPTSLVCPEAPIECVVVDSTGSKQYDLSR